MWLIISALLFIGLVLIIVELVFIPGTTIIGLLGVVFCVAGILVGYRNFGNETGHYILLGVSVLLLASLFYSFRSGAWSKFSLKSSIDSKVNEGMLAGLKVGDEGKTLSALRPFGKAEFNQMQCEVKTLGDYLDSGKPIRIIRIDSHQIIVEPINQL